MYIYLYTRWTTTKKPKVIFRVYFVLAPVTRGSGSRHVFGDTRSSSICLCVCVCGRGRVKEKVGPKTSSVFHLPFRHLLLNKSSSPAVDGEYPTFIREFSWLKGFSRRLPCCAMSRLLHFSTAYNLCCYYFYFFKFQKQSNDVWRKQSTLRLKDVTRHFHPPKRRRGRKKRLVSGVIHLNFKKR